MFNKKVLCVDIGNVLLEIDSDPLRKLFKRNVYRRFFGYMEEHDIGRLSDLQFWEELNKHLLKMPMRLTDFARVYARCFPGINFKMYETLYHFKEEERGRLVCISDINPFVLALISLKIPQSLDLFNDGKQGNWIFSCEKHSLKKNGTPFRRACSEFGFSPGEAALVDDRHENIEAAVCQGFDKSSCFLYRMKRANNHERFEKFLDKLFLRK